MTIDASTGPTITVRMPRELYARATRRAGELTVATGRHVTPAKALAEAATLGLEATTGSPRDPDP
jgi:predicted transcriptional regulator